MKIRASVAEIFAKQYWCFLIIDFQCIFDILAIMHLRSLQRWMITEWLWNFFKTRSQNGPISVKWKHQYQLIFWILRLSHKHITFDILKKHPVVNRDPFPIVILALWPTFGTRVGVAGTAVQAVNWQWR